MNTTTFPPAPDAATVAALEQLLEQHWEDEIQDYRNRSEQEDVVGHVFLDLLKVRNWLRGEHLTAAEVLLETATT